MAVWANCFLSIIFLARLCLRYFLLFALHSQSAVHLVEQSSDVHHGNRVYSLIHQNSSIKIIFCYCFYYSQWTRSISLLKLSQPFKKKIATKNVLILIYQVLSTLWLNGFFVLFRLLFILVAEFTEAFCLHAAALRLKITNTGIMLRLSEV